VHVRNLDDSDRWCSGENCSLIVHLARRLAPAVPDVKYLHDVAIDREEDSADMRLSSVQQYPTTGQRFVPTRSENHAFIEPCTISGGWQLNLWRELSVCLLKIDAGHAHRVSVDRQPNS
jgi:hypothetical protein